VAAIVIGAIVLSSGPKSSHPAAAASNARAARSSAVASAGNGFPADPSISAAAGGDLSCLRISETPTLSGAFDDLRPTTDAPPSGVPLPASTPTASCTGNLQFTDGSHDPAFVYSYAGVTTTAYETVLTAAGWTESEPATADQPAVWDLDSSDYEIDFLTSGADLIVIVDDEAEGSNGSGSAPSAVTPS
jgi:hypothetical protein